MFGIATDIRYYVTRRRDLIAKRDTLSYSVCYTTVEAFV